MSSGLVSLNPPFLPCGVLAGGVEEVEEKDLCDGRAHCANDDDVVVVLLENGGLCGRR